MRRCRTASAVSRADARRDAEDKQPPSRYDGRVSEANSINAKTLIHQGFGQSSKHSPIRRMSSDGRGSGFKSAIPGFLSLPARYGSSFANTTTRFRAGIV